MEVVKELESLNKKHPGLGRTLAEGLSKKFTIQELNDAYDLVPKDYIKVIQLTVGFKRHGIAK